MNNRLHATASPSIEPASGGKLHPHWWTAGMGIWGLTWQSKLVMRRWPALLVALVSMPLLAFFTLSDGQEEAFLRWAIDFYLLLLLPLYCLFVCGGMIRDEVQANTLGFLITRPVTRTQLFVFEFLGQMVWIQAIAMVNGLLLWAVGVLRQIPDINALAGLLLGTQVLAVWAYSALSALFGLIHPRYMVLGIIYGLVVELGIGRIPTNINSLSMSHHLQTLLSHFASLRNLYQWSPAGSGFSLCVLVLAPILFLGLGSVLFTYREYHHGEEMQK